MNWPNERIPKGGIFHPHKVTYSKETHELINLLMEEQKLTMLQRNKINYHLRNGEPLPDFEQNQPSNKMHTSIGYEERMAYEIMQRARTARKRTLEMIKSSGAYEMEKYIPIHHLREPSDKQKLMLQERMSGIKHYPELDHRIKSKYKNRHSKSLSAVIDVTPSGQIDELLKEIYERADWLAEMEELGEGKKHRLIIQGQIAERLRKIHEIEKLNDNGK